MSKFPVIFSISVTMTSAISMLGTPSEIYRYGLQPVVTNLGLPIGIVLAAYVFIPVYFQCGVSTVYEAGVAFFKYKNNNYRTVFFGMCRKSTYEELRRTESNINVIHFQT
ncbi:hypothetical protein TNCV_2680502 [Trichonephila clavipes]|uniref:Uncharacterized protein n=1 Tax=Trichonephila clavipes TaxID=2585209 RepID=A0A8X6SFZ0_TRICX|nr:hypothetical protein TNCV_2680502 [Trichonephila clavipes]